MLWYKIAESDCFLSREEIKTLVFGALDALGRRKKVLIVPPDFTRFHSMAGILTGYILEYYGSAVTDILPAIGTHAAMSAGEIASMYPGVPASLFRHHNWRKDVLTLGEVPGHFIREVSEGKLDYPWPAQVNRLIVEGGFDLILSVGQVVPHEVIGMANYNKNLFVGTGGTEGIHKSHFLGAVYGMERIMGRAINPVRKVLNYASEHFASHLPVIYLHTVVSRDTQMKLGMNGLFIGDDMECFTTAADLSLEKNFEMLDEPLNKVVVYLDRDEFKSTWLGNKSIYRTRMAIADRGDLIVLAPGVKTFGEDLEIDRLIRKYGYRTTPEILDYVKKNEDLRNNLAAAAHLIHGSPENRFRITYCPGTLTKEEIEGVNFSYAPLDRMLEKYSPSTLTEGFNTLADGETIFYISNPALGLWSTRSRFTMH